MSCWVAPSIAAELWGISVEQVLQRAREGTVASRTDVGFFLVDVAPPKPETFVAITPEEQAALGDGPDEQAGVTQPVPAPLEPFPVAAAPVPVPAPLIPAPVAPADDELPNDVAAEEPRPAVPFEEWRKVRSRTAFRRVPPRRSASATA